MRIIDKRLRLTPAQSFIYDICKDLRSLSLAARELHIHKRRLLDILQSDIPIESDGEFKRILGVWSRFYLDSKKKEPDPYYIDYGDGDYARSRSEITHYDNIRGI